MNKAALAAALKAIPGARGSIAPQSSGMGRVSPTAAELYINNSYRNTYGPFHPRPARDFSEGAFSPMPPIQPVPVDEPPDGGLYPDPRYWQYRVGWNLPTPPGTEGLKLASFDQLRVLSQRYSVARACIDLRQQEIRGLVWEVTLTKNAAKAYQNSHSLMKDFGERAAQATRFFRRPDPGYWNFDAFLNAMLEEILVYDALSLIFRPKYGAKFGQGGRGLLGSDLDSLRLVSGPTIRPLVDMHGDIPAPPAPGYQQYLYGVPRSDYLTIMRGTDIEDTGLAEAKVGEFTSDIMLYAPYWPTRESPYGFPPVERALLPIISGLQKQEFQLDYFTEGTVPSVYISPGDPNITPTQIKELQDALNGIAGDPAYHMKVIVLPPGSKVEPQRPVDLSDSFDQLVMNQVCMAFDVQPMELGIVPNIGGGPQGPSASAIRFAAQEARDVKSRKSTKPLLQWICNIFDYILQDVCGQPDMRFQFEGLADEEDKQAITELGVQQVQNGIASIDEVRDRLDLAPWGLKETSEPVVFTAQGPIPISMAPQLIAMAQGAQQQGGSRGGGSSGGNSGTQSTNSGQRTSSSRTRTSQPSVRAGGQTKPNGSHPAPVAPHRESITPAHSAAAGAIQSPTPRTGGSPSRSSVAGSRKKAAASELDALKRHLRKDRNAVYGWQPKHIDTITLAKIADDLNAGMLIDKAIERAAKAYTYQNPDFLSADSSDTLRTSIEYRQADDLLPVPAIGEMHTSQPVPAMKAEQWPGWEHDLGLVGAYKQQVGKAFRDAQAKGDELRKKAANGSMFVSRPTLSSMIADEVYDSVAGVLGPLWTEAWHLGYEAAKSLVKDTEPDFTKQHPTQSLESFIASEGEHWLQKITRTGIASAESRAEIIARTEVARAMNAAAIQAYRDNGISYKHLLIAPDDTCDICKSAAAEGVIPLDAIFPGGGLGGPMHPDCRCVPAPADINVIPPQAHLGKSEAEEDEHVLVWLLLRARDEDGKYRFLLQQRDDGTWGMPGGHAHVGEDPWQGALRETTEEIGDLPELACIGTFHHMEDDGQTQVYLYLCDTRYFRPELNGSTPEETRGTGWFRRKEIDALNLVPKFREDWDEGITLRDHAAKALQRMVDENGTELYVNGPGQELQATGARWPYPHRPDGADDPEQHYGTAETAEPPRWDGTDGPVEMTEPRGGNDGDYPRGRKPNKPGSRFPDQGGQRYPSTDNGDPGPAAAGVPKSRSFRVMHGGTPRLVTGSTPPVTPHPYEPQDSIVQPEPYDPAMSVPVLTPEGDAYYSPKSAGGPSDYSDPNPVDAEHIYLQMAKNFPPDAIEWVKRARWIGPVNIPWERIDSDGIESWAASHQPGKVGDFVKLLRAHDGRVAPSVLIQDNDTPKAIIIDGHHRALAHRKLGQPVLGYVGMIDPKDRKAAEETHSKQIHSGSDPRNA